MNLTTQIIDLKLLSLLCHPNKLREPAKPEGGSKKLEESDFQHPH
jgi:hypothetical protein